MFCLVGRYRIREAVLGRIKAFVASESASEGANADSEDRQ